MRQACRRWTRVTAQETAHRMLSGWRSWQRRQEQGRERRARSGHGHEVDQPGRASHLLGRGGAHRDEDVGSAERVGRVELGADVGLVSDWEGRPSRERGGGGLTGRASGSSSEELDSGGVRVCHRSTSPDLVEEGQGGACELTAIVCCLPSFPVGLTCRGSETGRCLRGPSRLSLSVLCWASRPFDRSDRPGRVCEKTAVGDPVEQGKGAGGGGGGGKGGSATARSTRRAHPLGVEGAHLQTCDALVVELVVFHESSRLIEHSAYALFIPRRSLGVREVAHVPQLRLVPLRDDLEHLVPGEHPTVAAHPRIRRPIQLPLETLPGDEVVLARPRVRVAFPDADEKRLPGRRPVMSVGRRPCLWEGLDKADRPVGHPVRRRYSHRQQANALREREGGESTA